MIAASADSRGYSTQFKPAIAGPGVKFADRMGAKTGELMRDGLH